MGKIGDGIIGVLVAVVGLAIVAVVVSKNANTASVVTSAGNAFSSIIAAATGPVAQSGSVHL